MALYIHHRVQHNRLPPQPCLVRSIPRRSINRVSHSRGSQSAGEGDEGVSDKKKERKKERTNERKKASKKEKNCLSFFRQSTSIPMISWINYSDSLCNRGRNAVEQTRAHTYTRTRAQEQQQKQHESSRDSLDLRKNISLKHTNAGRQKA